MQNGFCLGYFRIPMLIVNNNNSSRDVLYLSCVVRMFELSNAFVLLLILPMINDMNDPPCMYLDSSILACVMVYHARRATNFRQDCGRNEFSLLARYFPCLSGKGSKKGRKQESKNWIYASFRKITRNTIYQ